MPDLKPVEPPFSPEVEKVLKRYPQRGGHLLSIFRVFANSLRFLVKGVPNFLDEDSPLPLRQREIVILRVTANNRCSYEWGVHVAAFARAASFTDEQIYSTWHGTTGLPCWTPSERILISVVDQLCRTGSLDEETKTRFSNEWSAEEQLEIFALCGAYHTVSFVANVAGLEPEPFGARPPARA